MGGRRCACLLQYFYPMNQMFRLTFRAVLMAIMMLPLLLSTGCNAQKKPVTTSARPTPAADRLKAHKDRVMLENSSPVADLPFRCVGPTVMSGRVVDLEVDPQDPTHFFVAYASGGLWETFNNGASFTPIFDQEAVITIGDIAVEWQNNGDIWIGTGEVNSSRSSYSGTGIYRGYINPSYIEGVDTQKYIWTHMGLSETHHIGRVITHGQDNPVLWVAALGHLYSEHPDKGVFKSTDGGQTWKHSFSLEGVSDLVLDPYNPNHLFAAAWDRSRQAWNFEEAGPGTGIYETTDGGDTWTKISGGPGSSSSGFPVGDSLGRIGLALYSDASGSMRLYAFLDNQHKKAEEDKEDQEALKKEMFQNMSNETFAALDDKKLETFLRDNGFPEEHTAASVKEQVSSGKIKPADLYDYLFEASAIFYEKPVIGAEVYRFESEGRKWIRTHEKPLDDVVFSYGYYFGLIKVSPSDHNKLYIAGVPLLTSDDGGATWKGINPENVHVDHHALWINPGRQGHIINGSDGGVQISYDDGATWVNCNSPAVGQFYTVAVDDAKPYHVYGGLQDNGVWVGPSTNEPDRNWYQSGKYPFDFLMGGDGMQVQVDTRDNQTVYTGYQFGQYARLNRRDGWEQGIHPMHKLGEKPLRWNWQTPILLSAHHQDILYICSNKVHRSLDKGNTFETLSGDLTRGEKIGDVPYATLTSITESPLQFGLLAVGSDDGLVHLSRDNGYTWEAVDYATALQIPSNLWVSRIVLSSHKKERLYLTLNGYRNDHFQPYVLMSDDLGRTWKRISANLPCEPVNVVREDPSDEKILYLGTDHGLYITLDGGNHWARFGTNMPDVPVHDLAIQKREKDLVVGTHGRSIWIGDLEQVQKFNTIRDSALYVFEPEKLNHSKGWGSNWSQWLKPNEPEFTLGVYVKEAIGPLAVEIWWNDSLKIREFATPSLAAGIHRVEYDFSLTETTAEMLVKAINSAKKADDPEVKIEKADNQKYYPAPGSYTIRVRAAGIERRRLLVLE